MPVEQLLPQTETKLPWKAAIYIYSLRMPWKELEYCIAEYIVVQTAFGNFITRVRSTHPIVTFKPVFFDTQERSKSKPDRWERISELGYELCIYLFI